MDANPKMVSVRLRELVTAGLVARTYYAEVPPRVEYALTDLGRSFLPIVEQLKDWAEAHSTELMARHELVSA